MIRRAVPSQTRGTLTACGYCTGQLSGQSASDSAARMLYLMVARVWSALQRCCKVQGCTNSPDLHLYSAASRLCPSTGSWCPLCYPLRPALPCNLPALPLQAAPCTFPQGSPIVKLLLRPILPLKLWGVIGRLNGPAGPPAGRLHMHSMKQPSQQLVYVLEFSLKPQSTHVL